MTEEQYLGMLEVKEGIKERGLHLAVSDKSKKMVLTSVDKYLDGLKQHTQKDTQVTLQDVTRGGGAHLRHHHPAYKHLWYREGV